MAVPNLSKRTSSNKTKEEICRICKVSFQKNRPSDKRLYCSVACYDLARGARPAPGKRECVICGEPFIPERHSHDARYCSPQCIWKATKGPEFNAKIAKSSAGKRGDSLRDKGECKTYRKLNGRHEHRIVVEENIGRPLLSSEVVHHKDGNVRNNDVGNLVILTRAQHMREHGLAIPGRRPPWEPWKAKKKVAADVK